MLKLFPISFALILFAQSASANAVKLGLNDVSILLPYNTYPELFQTAPSIKDFVPEASIRAIDTALETDQEFQDEKTVFFRVNKTKIFDYRLTSMRIDPFRLEFRLVWQKTDGSGRNLRFDDNNIHAIHKMTAAEFGEIVATLRQLKAQAKTDSISLPLQPNPTIVEEGLNSVYYKGVIGLVQKYIRADNLIELAFLADTNQSGHWPLLKLGVKAGGTTVLPIPGTDALVQRMDGRANLDDPMPLGNLFSTRNDPERLEKAFALENPRLHGVDSLDCASCHRSHLEKVAILERNPSLPIPSSQYRSNTWNLDALYGIADEQSMQLFSYFLRNVKIAPRVINESAEVADYINSLK